MVKKIRKYSVVLCTLILCMLLFGGCISQEEVIAQKESDQKEKQKVVEVINSTPTDVDKLDASPVEEGIREVTGNVVRAVPKKKVLTKPKNVTKITVTRHNKKKAYEGYNLIGSTLFFMNGTKVKRLNGAVFEIFEDGSYLTAEQNRRIVKYDWEGNKVWGLDIINHHDITSNKEVVYSIGKEIIEFKNTTIGFDTIIEYDTARKELKEWSTLENQEEIQKFHLPKTYEDTITSHEECRVGPYDGACYDYHHINAIQVLPKNKHEKDDKRFESGNLLISYSFVDLITIQDKETKKILWAWGPGNISFMHTPRMLENGNILIFENGQKQKKSRVIELDPITKEIVWQYQGVPPESFYSYSKGSSQRLPNNNTLIADSTGGRVFEVTMDGDIVWEALIPIEEHGRGLYRIQRIEKEIVENRVQK